MEVVNLLKNNKKRTIIILSSAILGIALITAFLLIFVFNVICFHEWQDATCTSPKTCIKCRQISGEKLGHSWIAATCETPEMCSVCGEIRAEALGHNWAKADCENPKICNTCKKTDGQALGHDWKAATCETPKTCKTCGKTEGTAKGHNWLEATYTSPETCSYCGETRGDVLADPFVGNWTDDYNPTNCLNISKSGNKYYIDTYSLTVHASGASGVIYGTQFVAYLENGYLYTVDDSDYFYIDNGKLHWNDRFGSMIYSKN